MNPEHGIVKMAKFAVDFQTKIPYPLVSPQGGESFRSLKTSRLIGSNGPNLGLTLGCEMG